METRSCQNCKKDFIIEPDDFGFYEKMKVPAPTFCPECRLIRRLAWRNERGLHSRECGLCGKKIVSIYNKDFQNVVYCDRCWWSDKWEALDYGVDYDFSKPFLQQLFELFRRVPAPNLFAFGTTMINSPYCNMANDMKNCYLTHDGTFAENVSYSSGVFDVKDTQDVMRIRKCELCYECVTCLNCYQTFFSKDCTDCVNVYFSEGLRGCNNCFGCVNLSNKNYHIFNEPYTKQEYEAKLKSFGLYSYKNITSLKEKISDFWRKFPKKYYWGMQNLNVTGDYILHSKNAKMCFWAANVEDSKFCSFVSNGPIKTTYDFTHYGDNIELVYECLQAGDGLYNCKFGWGNWQHTKNADYSITVPGSSDIFGCIGLKKKKYCILNKQYTKEEYEELIPKITKHMNDIPYIDKKGNEYRYGEFFPIELSPFGYNETTAQDFFYIDEKEALVNGYNWTSREKRNYGITKNHKDLPDSIIDVPDSILNEVIGCEHKGECKENCMAAFKILPEDLKFYRRIGMPLPRLCPNCRHYRRLRLRNLLKLWHRSCMCDKKHTHHEGRCEAEFETSYAPDRPEIVYCEKCYQQEVY